jgi:hypothetical protein
MRVNPIRGFRPSPTAHAAIDRFANLPFARPRNLALGVLFSGCLFLHSRRRRIYSWSPASVIFRDIVDEQNAVHLRNRYIERSAIIAPIRSKADADCSRSRWPGAVLRAMERSSSRGMERDCDRRAESALQTDRRRGREHRSNVCPSAAAYLKDIRKYVSRSRNDTSCVPRGSRLLPAALPA